MHRFISALSKYHADCNESMKSISNVFPIEVDLPVAMLNDLKLISDDNNNNDYGDYEEEENDHGDDDEDEKNKYRNVNDENLLDLK